MKLDDFIAGTWLTCEDWYYSFRCDQWWILRATCNHHNFETTCGVFKLEGALDILYDRIVKFHEELGND
jgi:hypothetical protein